MRKPWSVVPVAAAYGLSAFAYGSLPAAGTVDLSPLMPVSIGTTETIGPMAAAMLIPTTAFGVWALLMSLSLVRGRPGTRFPLNEGTGAGAIDRFSATYATVAYAVTGLLALGHLAVIASLLAWPIWSFQLMAAGVGISLIVAGNVVPRTRPNWIVGIRTRRTLSDPSVWAHTHRMLGVLLVASGVGVVLLSMLALRFALGFALLAPLVSIVVSHRVGRERSEVLPV
jgi:hypothetical protein